mgnify:CR=1 FL=1
MNVNNLICKYCDTDSKGSVTINDIIRILGASILLLYALFLSLIPIMMFSGMLPMSTDDNIAILYPLFFVFGLGIDLFVLYCLGKYTYNKIKDIKIVECHNKKEVK